MTDPTATSRLTGDEYMAVLLDRQATYEAEQAAQHTDDIRPHSWARPLLEWFIRPGDELLFTPPAPVPQPKRETTPRVYRTAASLRVERDRLAAEAARLTTPLSSDRAASGGVALGRKRTARLIARQDRRLRRYVALDHRIRALDDRIARAERREAKEAADD